MYLHVPHGMTAIVQVHKTQHLSICHPTNCEQALLSNPNLVYGRRNLLNAATLLPDPDQIDDHKGTMVTEDDPRQPAG